MSRKELARKFVEKYYSDPAPAAADDKCNSDCSGKCKTVNG